MADALSEVIVLFAATSEVPLSFFGERELQVGPPGLCGSRLMVKSVLMLTLAGRDL